MERRNYHQQVVKFQLSKMHTKKTYYSDQNHISKKEQQLYQQQEKFPEWDNF